MQLCQPPNSRTVTALAPPNARLLLPRLPPPARRHLCSYVNTTACKSTVSYIDGDKGILRYRGYPIEELAERSSFLEVWGGPAYNTLAQNTKTNVLCPLELT